MYRTTSHINDCGFGQSRLRRKVLTRSQRNETSRIVTDIIEHRGLRYQLPCKGLTLLQGPWGRLRNQPPPKYHQGACRAGG